MSCSITNILWCMLVLETVAGVFFELQPYALSDCFGLGNLHTGSVVEGTYDSVGESGKEGILASLVLVDHPYDTSVVWERQSRQGHLSMPIGTSGSYKICFTSSVPVPQTVSFSVKIEKKAGDGGKSEGQAATTDHTNELRDIVKQLRDKVDTLMDQQRYGITREAVHRSKRVFDYTFSRLFLGAFDVCDVVIQIRLNLLTHVYFGGQ
ncbi:hypothetical protein FOL47_007402 [Perkinsus chesapeaki]|uniref:GOLD domain-containing protein n=1 Tax=Perkinsus chesapeaki TaxID=330153 RepID=A0A7J6LL08_PERCH|nr:hypothetical protein FOL47_007402 [Perkinsus chesapeaki]